MRRITGLAAAVGAIVLAGWAAPGSAHAQDADGVYTNANGNWNDSANWQSNVVANGMDKTATFRGVAATGVTVTNDTSLTVGNLTLNHTSGAYPFALRPLDETVFLTLAATPPAIPVLSGVQGSALTISTPFLGTQGLVKVGSQPIILDSTNSTYSGDTVVAQGALRVAVSSEGLPVTRGPLGVSRLVLKAGGTLQSSGASGRTLANELVLDDDLVFYGGVNYYGALTFTGPIQLTGSRTLQSVNVTLTFQGVCSDGGNSYRLTKTGGGNLVMSAPHTYGGGTVLGGGGLLIGGSSVGAPVTAGPLGSGPLSILSGTLASAGPNGAAWHVANPVSMDGDLQLGTSGNYSYLHLDSPLALTGNRVVSVTTYSTGYPVYLNAGLDDAGGGHRLTIRVTGGILNIGGTNVIGGGVRVWDGALAIEPGSAWQTPGLALQDSAVTLRVQNVPASNTPLPQVAFEGGNPTLWVRGAANGGVMSVDRLVRQGRAALALAGNAGAIGALTANDRLLVTNGAPILTAGMVEPCMVEYSGDFLTYDGALGFKRATYTITNDINAAGAAAIHTVTAPQTLSADNTIHALRVTTNLLAGAAPAPTLALAGGGLIGVGGGAAIDCDLQFGEREALIWNSGGLSLNGVVRGSNGVTKSGSGTLILGGSNAYTGVTTVNAGTLRLGAPGALPAGQPLVVNSGVVDLNGAAADVNGLTLTGGLVTNNSAAAPCVLAVSGIAYDGPYRPASVSAGAGTNLVLDFGGTAGFDVGDGYSGDDLTVSAGVRASNGLRKTGGGTLYLSANNAATLTGPLAVKGGVLKGRAGQSGTNSLGPTGAAIELSGNGAVYQQPMVGNAVYENGAVTFAGGNWIRNSGMQTASLWLMDGLGRAPGSRGTLVVNGSYTATGYYDFFGANVNYKLRLAGQAAVAHLPACIVQVRNPGDPASNEGSHTLYTAAGGATLDNIAYVSPDIHASGALTNYSAGAVQQLTNDCTVYCLRASADIQGAGYTLTVAGDPTNLAGVVVNNPLTLAPRMRFGAGGDLEGCVFVRGGMTGVFDGGVETSAGLTKFGPGTLRLAQDSSLTYTAGGTAIQAGVLQIGNAAAMGPASNPVFIQQGASLELLGSYTLGHAISGEGAIVTTTNLLTLGTGGSLAPGAAGETGTLAVEDLDFRGTYHWQYDGTHADLIACATLAFGGGATVNCQWLGGGTPAMGTNAVFTYQGAAPDVGAVVIVAPTGLQGELSVDSANQRVLLALEPRTAKGSVLHVR